MDFNTLWKSTLGDLETTLTKPIFKMFFSVTKIGECGGNSVEVICPNEYTADQINKRFYGLLKNTLDRLGGGDFKISFKIEKVEIKSSVDDLPLFTHPVKEAADTSEMSGLSPKYTFETFIVGPSNRLAHAIAAAISENPGKAYNPFFLYAGVGLGKTHLMQAIGNKVLVNNPKAKIVYATAESFMNELIETIQEGRNKNYTANKFRNKFRKADVLLVDDIQFIAGRGEATQEEFFHTFNALYMSSKQIVLTSDRPPKELSKLDARITSRFSSGIVSDMQKPDVETRSAILREKRNLLRIELANDVVDYIALTVETNIRELEGAFLQVITQGKTDGVDMTKEFAAKVLGKTIISKHNVNVNDVLKTVCNYYSIKLTDLKGKRRIKEFVLPRQVSMFLLKELTGTPFMAIGDLLGRRDHTTIMHGVEKIENLIPLNIKLKQDVVNIKKTLSVSGEG